MLEKALQFFVLQYVQSGVQISLKQLLKKRPVCLATKFIVFKLTSPVRDRGVEFIEFDKHCLSGAKVPPVTFSVWDRLSNRSPTLLALVPSPSMAD